MFSRRDLVRLSVQGYVGAKLAPFMSGPTLPRHRRTGLRCINVVNFIREIEPRFPMDMMLPVRNQMELVLKHDLPATWLLQFDALVSGPFVPFLKERMARDHEVGFWFEMNEKHCRAAGVQWRGRPGYEWDFTPSVAFTIGYTKDERVKLADTAMAEFKRIWGRYPSSVASWNLDSVTLAHLTDRYAIDAYAVCRDQIATDGFTIWGAPIAGYYPSRLNCWSPAADPANQIGTPIFRMLGQDPVYYYDRVYRMPGRSGLDTPDTMEPAWPPGRDPVFVGHFLDMLENAPSLGFAYAQLGQENTFPWDQQAPGYPHQTEALAALRRRGAVHVETMGESGRRFKGSFKQTPAQAQVMLDDPFGNSDPACGSIWYQSRFYRANLHLKGDLFYLRDLTVYSDRIRQPFLDEPTRESYVDQKMPAVVDGYHWKGSPGPAGAFFYAGEEQLRLAGKPEVRESGSILEVRVPVQGGQVVQIRFDEKGVSFRLTPGANQLSLALDCDPSKSTLAAVGSKIQYRWQDLDYNIVVRTGTPAATSTGWRIGGSAGGIELELDRAS